MKKMMTFVAACLCMLLLSACGSDLSTPQGTVEKAMKCLMEKDYEGYVDLVQFENSDELTKEQLSDRKTQVIAILQDKGAKEFDTKGGIKSYEIAEPVIDGEKAVVKAVVTYGNDETSEQKFNLVKNEKGDWLLDSGK